MSVFTGPPGICNLYKSMYIFVLTLSGKYVNRVRKKESSGSWGDGIVYLESDTGALLYTVRNSRAHTHYQTHTHTHQLQPTPCRTQPAAAPAPPPSTHVKGHGGGRRALCLRLAFDSVRSEYAPRYDKSVGGARALNCDNTRTSDPPPAPAPDFCWLRRG